MHIKTSAAALALGFLLIPASALAATVSIQSLSPGSTVNVGMTVFFSAAASGFTSPSYSVYDSNGNSSVTGSAMNSSGGFHWTPLAQDVGSHTLTVTVTDGSTTTTATQAITVNPAPSVTLSSPSGAGVIGQAVTFTATPTSFTSPAYSISDSFQGSSAGNQNINASGAFSWVPVQNDVGTHVITVQVNDSLGNSASASQTLNIQRVSVGFGTTTPGTTVPVGTQVSFPLLPLGFTSPIFTFADSMYGTSVTAANLTGTNFAWTPTARDVGQHILTFQGSDAYSHSGNGSITINVTAGTSTAATSAPAPAAASKPSGLSSTQVQAILGLLQSFGADAATLAKVTAALNGTAAPSTGTTAGAKYKFLKPLDVGAKGTEVIELQKRLTAEGVYSGEINGVYDALTLAAVKKYQSLHNLNQLGNVGPGTRASLNGN